MAEKLSKEEREKTEKHVKDLEEENADLKADVALLKLERERESENETLKSELGAFGSGGD